MADLNAVRAALGTVVDAVIGTRGYLQQALSDIEAQIGHLMAIMDGSNQDDVQAAIAALNATRSSIQDAMEMTGATNVEIEGIQARL